MAFIRKIKAALVKIDIEDYVGESTYIFYDIVTGELRIHDGTPGGVPLVGGGGGGGTAWGTITGTLSNQTDLQTALDNATITTWGDVIGTLTDQTDLTTYIDNATEEEMFAAQIDFITDDLLYRGEAVPGAATNTATWRIRKITIDNSGEGDIVTVWADGNDNFDNIWDNRLGLSYS